MDCLLKIAIVDDMPDARQLLTQKIGCYMDSRCLKYEIFMFENGEDFVFALEKERFDIVFMDIYMDAITGIDCAEKLRLVDRDCKLIFVTSTTDFLGDGYAYNPCHYLVKPFEDDAFEQAMQNCQIKRQIDMPFFDAIVAGEPARIDTTQIIYIDTFERNVFVHLVSGTISLGRGFSSISEIFLADRRFIQSIKGVLVNMDFIATVDQSVFVLKNGERLLMAVRNKNSLVKQYRSYQFECASNRTGVNV